MTQARTLPLLAMIAILALSVTPGRAVAQGEEPGFEPGIGGRRSQGGPGGRHMALRSLDLSKSQREEIREIFETERGQIEAEHERMRALGAELREQIDTDPFDEEAVRARAAAVAALRVEMAVLRARQSGRIRDLLTPAQLDQLRQMQEERRSFRGQRGQGRGRFEQRRRPGSGS